MELKRLTSVDGHRHIALLREDLTGSISVARGHAHEIAWDDTLQSWVVGFGPDGHTHSLEDVPVKQGLADVVDDVETETRIVGDVFDLFSAWSEMEGDSVQRGQAAEDFIDGEQWGSDEKAHLESVERAALVLNKLERYTDVLLGWQRQNRTDIVFKPQEGGDQIVSDILSHLIKYDSERCYFPREESKVFADIVVPGRGVWNVYLDRMRDLEGDINFERFQWDDVVFGPHEKEDLSDCEGMIKYRLISKARLKLEHPEKVDQIDSAYASFLPGGNPSIQFSLDRDWWNVNRGTALLHTIDIAAKSFRVFECWRKYYYPIDIAMSLDGTWVQSLEGWSPGDRAAVRSLTELAVIEKPQYRFRCTKVCAGVVLYDNFPEFAPANSFPCVPVYAKRRRNKFRGKVEMAMDAQREINKRHSQTIDIGNKMCSYGWFISQGMFASPEGEEEFKATASSPGFVSTLQDINVRPSQVEGVKFPGELVQLMQIADVGLQSLVNIEPTPTGANESGSHFYQQQKLKLLGNEYLFDHLSESKKRLGEIYVSLVQRYYSPQKVMRILNSVRSQDPEMQIAGQPLENYEESSIFELFQNLDVSKYDVVVSESSYSPSARLSTFALLTDLARAGQPIPPEVIIEFLDAPDSVKKRIQSALAAQAESQAQAEQQKMQTEENKTLIAKDIIPPETQQRIMSQMSKGEESNGR